MLTSSTRKLENAMARAETYEQWSELAQAHDRKTGMERWRRMDPSRRYDYVSIRMRLDKLRSLRARHDNIGLLFTLNEGIHGNMGGMGRAPLYAKAKFGTKQLVVDYVDEIVSVLEHLASPEVDEITFEDKLDFFRRAHHCFGSSSLMMSGAGTLLYFHLGVVKALWAEGLLPDILSGSSGGAIVAAILGTHNDKDLTELFASDYLQTLIKTKESKRIAITPQRIAPDVMRSTLEKLIPDLTFEEAFELTGRNLNIPIAPAEDHQTSRLLNATTSPNVYIIEAVQASAATKGVYPPVTLAAKNMYGERQAYLPSRQWVDGSLGDDLPAKRLARLYGVNHNIVSQTNPYVMPFVNDIKMKSDTWSIVQHLSQRVAREYVKAGASVMNFYMGKRKSVILDKVVNATLTAINQDYVGDIGILPPGELPNPMKLLGLSTKGETQKIIRMGERATWPKIEMIRVQTKISRALHNILADYEEGLPGQVHHREIRRRA